MKGNGFFAVFFCVLLIFMLCVEGCGAEKKVRTENEGKSSVQVGEVRRDVAFAPFYVSLANGYFEDEQLHIKLNTMTDPKQIRNNLLDGTYHVGLMECEGCMETCENDDDPALVMFALLTARAESILLCREEQVKFSWTALKDATVLTVHTEAGERILRYILEKNMLEDAVEIQTFENVQELMEAFQKGEGDYALLSHPYAEQLMTTGTAYFAQTLGEDSGFVPGSSFCVERNILECDKEMLERFAKALQRGMDYVSEHSAEEVGEAIAPYFSKTEKKSLAKMIERYKECGLWKENLMLERQEYGLLQNIMIDSGQPGHPVSYGKICDMECAQKAIRDRTK